MVYGDLGRCSLDLYVNYRTISFWCSVVTVSANPAALNIGCDTMDEAMHMEAHVNNISRVCYYHLHNSSMRSWGLLTKPPSGETDLVKLDDATRKWLS